MARSLSSQPTWDCLLHPKGKEGAGKRQCFLEKAGFYQVEHGPVPIGYAKAPHGTLLPSTAKSAMELDSYQLPHNTREANEKVGGNGDKGLGEAAQWLRAYAVLPQDQSLVSSTPVRWPTQLTIKSAPGRFGTSDLHWRRGLWPRGLWVCLPLLLWPGFISQAHNSLVLYDDHKTPRV